MPKISADWVLLEDGWAQDAVIAIDPAGFITGVHPGGDDDADTDHCDGALIPGMPNLHSHTFQRSFAGRTEFLGGGGDFWSWREAMYRAAATIEPESLAPITAYLGMLALRGGFTSLVEFHYLQNAPDGSPYAKRAAMAEAVISGAKMAGIGLTLLVGIYETANFDGSRLQGAQRRFATGPEDALRMVADLRAREGADLRLGLAPHSLRAVKPGSLKDAAAGLAAIDPAAPIHIHAAEQQAELRDGLAVLGATPVAWLLENVPLGPNWCLIHATHATEAERAGMAARGVVAGLCPTTEGNLGDGIFGLRDFVGAGGRFGIGTDSHVGVDAFAELRLLEYTQRLTLERRNVLAGAQGSSGRRLWQEAAHGGAQAAARPVGRIAPGCRADFVVIGPTPETEDLPPAFWLDAAIFANDRRPARHVMVGGQWLVRHGDHVRQDEITRAYHHALARLG